MTQHNQDIDALNDVTKTLIDSVKGYEMACETCDDSYSLRSRFQQYAQERQQLVSEFQNQVRALGGEPVTSGGATGAVHRAMTQFSTIFRDDEKAALSAIDDGEDHLKSEIERVMERDNLNPETRSLLQRACQSAKEGECFADRMEEV